MNCAKGAARPISFSHQLRLRRTSSSETEKPRMVVTILRRLSPAGPTSLLRTSASICCEITCNSACAPEPKATMELVLSMSISSMRLVISALTGASASARATTALASVGSAITTAFTSSTRASVSCALAWIVVAIIKLSELRRAYALALQTFAQHFNFNS